jgi:hypothetical protein
MKPNHFILCIALCAMSCLYAACGDPCRESYIDPQTKIVFTIIDKTTRKNILDYSVGHWTDTIRVYDIQNKKLVGQSPGADGSMPLTFFDEQLDSDAFNTTKHKKFRINLQYSRDTIDVFFKMKRGHCDNIEIESIQAKYKDSTYNASTTNTWITFIKP